MSLYLVSYDLKQVGQNYDCIIAKLEALPNYWHFQQSVWLVQWHGSAFDLATSLQSCLDANDLLFVTKVTSDSAWSGYPQEGSDWIQRSL
jgi:hypothetical protein